MPLVTSTEMFKKAYEGVQGYVTKDATIDEIALAITTISKGNSYYNKAATEIMQSLLTKKGRANDITNDLSYLFDNYKDLSANDRKDCGLCPLSLAAN